MLALETHPAHRHPDQRMEPQQRQRKLRHKLRERVKALHVRELVRQHGDPLFFVHIRGAWHEMRDEWAWVRFYRNTLAWRDKKARHDAAERIKARLGW